MSLYHAQDSFEPPLTPTEKKQHWGTPPPSTGPIARPLVDGSGQPLLPVLAKNLKARVVADEHAATSPAAVNLNPPGPFGYEYRARQLQAQVLWGLTATFSRQAAGWIKRFAGRIFGRSEVDSAAQGEGRKSKSLSGTPFKRSRDYREARARLFGAGL